MRSLAAAVLASAAMAGPAAAAAPSGLSADPLDRAALLALPSVYRVEATVHVNGVRPATGPPIMLPAAQREFTEVGTAVAVAEGGWLVTAAHVAAPDDDTLARLAYQISLAVRQRPHADDDTAEAWVAAHRAVPIGARVRVVVAPAEAEPSDGEPREYHASDISRAEGADLALMRIPAPHAPALGLEETAHAGTPIVTIGFGRDSTLADAPQDPGVPAIRRGRITRSGDLDPDTPDAHDAIVVSAPVERGDSGGPVVDAQGEVRGIVTIKLPNGGIAEKATEVRQLLEAHGITPGAGPAADAFRTAMQALWRLDLPRAASGFQATLAAFPQHTLAPREQAQVQELEEASFSLRGTDRRREVLLAIGALAVVAALACAVALAWPSFPRMLGRGGGQ